MEIKQKDNGKRGLFFIEDNNETIAKLTYYWEDKVMVIDHTFVSKAYEGKGYGKQLLSKAVEYVRAHDAKIEPACPFAKIIMNRTSDYKSVLN